MLIDISAEETELLGPLPVFLSFLDRFLVSSFRTGFSFSPILKISFHRLELDGGVEEAAIDVDPVSGSDSGTGSVCTSTCTSVAISGGGVGEEERMGTRMPLEKRSSALERSGMELGREREVEEGQKENSWEEVELAELGRGEIVVSCSSCSFAIVSVLRV